MSRPWLGSLLSLRRKDFYCNIPAATVGQSSEVSSVASLHLQARDYDYVFSGVLQILQILVMKDFILLINN